MIPMVEVVVKKADTMKAVESEVMVVVTILTAVAAKMKEDTAVKKADMEVAVDTIVLK